MINSRHKMSPPGGATRGGEGPIPGRDGGAAQEGGRDRGRGRHRGRHTPRQGAGQRRRGSRRTEASNSEKLNLVTILFTFATKMINDQ